MELEFVRYEKRGRIAHVTMNRPAVMNALHPPAHEELDRVWDDFAADPECWVAILTGAGEKAFSAGNDLKWTAAIDHEIL
jgi:enoyl-CoA hydratase/carnithine racemase